MSIASMRTEYHGPALNEADASHDPIVQFGRWMDDAISAGEPEPNAMTLATVDATGAPSARIVLLKGFDASGFVFFTSYLSRKAQEMQANPHVALAIYWPSVHRQVRIEGTVAKVSRQESEQYFATRPRDSQLGAWASIQSELIADRPELEQRLKKVTARFGSEGPITAPETWGGYRVTPDFFEFWQGRPNRLHDRLRYTLAPEGEWIMGRLSP